MERIFLGAVVINIFLTAWFYLFVGGDCKSALAALEKSAIEKKFHLVRLLRFAFSLHHFLHLVKKFLCDNRFVLSFVQFAVVADNAVVKRILQKILKI
ncbi:MAG: hypothetical protein A2750_02965 [Candidatus Yanofskybacteria bacterium RIFCSPHIGHO2_01_FULL_45_42]|uniref:Uncharacterized protein n=2 Tax=Candidatus Yanofskyibacteriota TaxID=1752733 RepID=A0A1F8F172_9BACT|nr:MAG: hypothetical protein A2750_02965 [Candidatus Yanofskybacteria bacterium RIFCSPHIGHO2_01_FULL_45_42]OGN28040.1 MAG: hypothetical protein A3B17_02980 [Candidatus Yanofskybacteria bacterium RIFCSPLOWO2_01_FULL_45_72]OGN31652.1 MAG: hypothetical protein A3J01_01995 [Candidatus Yanofskybacteria bacterium RIFCSPLOWO2_02_FULL_45_18]